MRNIKLFARATELFTIFLIDVSAQINQQKNTDEFSSWDEIRQFFPVAPNARIEVSSIRGAIDIETADIKWRKYI